MTNDGNPNTMSDSDDQKQTAVISTSLTSLDITNDGGLSTDVKDSDPKHIILKFVSPNLGEIHYRVNSDSTSMLVCKTSFAKNIGVPASSLYFMFDGLRLKDEDTAKSFGLKDGDVIKVCQEVNGTEDPKRIKLIISGQGLDGLHVRVNFDGTTMGKYKESIAEQFGAVATAFYLLFNGRRIKDDETPKSLGLKDGDTIKVHRKRDKSGDQKSIVLKFICLGLDDTFIGGNFGFTSMGKYKETFASHHKTATSSLYLMFNGVRIKNEDTAKSLGLKSGDFIEVRRETVKPGELKGCNGQARRINPSYFM